VSAAERVRHGFERLHDAAVVRAVNNRRTAVRDVVRFDVVGTSAVEFGEVGQNAGPDPYARECGSQCEAGLARVCLAWALDWR
jgi:hypothetical protein